MIHTLDGKVIKKNSQFAVIKTGGIGFKVFLSSNSLRALPSEGGEVSIFCYFHLREDGASLFGFLSESELGLFELLIGVSGIGPKSALGILGIAPVEKVIAAIKEGRVELLTKVSGVGRKTAERIVLELKGKVESAASGELVKRMESDSDIEEALSNLGYTRNHVREVLSKIDPGIEGLENRLRAALKLLKK